MKKILLIAGGVVALVLILVVGIAIGSSTTTTKTVYVPAETAPAATAPAVPAPTVTQTVAPPAPTPGAVIDTFHGTGNQATPKFNVPSSGDYEVTWTFSGNTDGMGDGSGSNFIISNTGSGEGLGLANTIATSGHGSTVVSDGSGTDQLNVQATGSWTLTITAD